MNIESQVSELYSMLFNENIDPDALESLLKIFHDHDDSIDYIEITYVILINLNY